MEQADSISKLIAELAIEQLKQWVKRIQFTILACDSLLTLVSYKLGSNLPFLGGD
jgi:hypothetical protein